MKDLDNCETPLKVVEKLGYLLMLYRYVGSKSERVFPCLIGDEAYSVWLRHKDDDSFTHATLRPYHMNRVKVVGIISKNGQFTVETISRIEDPALER